MVMLRIEHAVRDFASWRKAFDSDPAVRKRSGVRRHQVLRALDDSNRALVHLDFDSRPEAEAFLSTLREIWKRVDGALIHGPQAQLFEIVETEG